jgi:hypothetical protein
MTFFVLPYIADVPYLDDNASTHDAEANSKVEVKAEANHDEIFPAAADSQNDSLSGQGLTIRYEYRRIAGLPTGNPSSRNLFHAVHISRPPPVA